MESTRPDAEAEHLLASLVVGRADPRELRDTEIAMLPQLAANHGLGPVLLAAVRNAGVDTDRPLWAPLVQHSRWVASAYLLSRVEQSRIEGELGLLGIPWVWLKGYALAHTVYPQPARRPMCDLDLLVPADRGDEAERALRAIGYQPISDAPPLVRGTGLLHHRPGLRSPSGVAVEMHERLHPSEQILTPSDLAWFLTQIEETQAAGTRVRHLKPEAQLLHLCSHAILQHGEADLRLQRFYDCHLLLAAAPQFDWAMLLERAAAFGYTYVVERALTITHRYFATPIPEPVWHGLRERRAATSRTRRITNIATGFNSPVGSFARARAIALTFRPSYLFRKYFRGVVPSAAYMRWRYGARGWALPFAYARRWYGYGRKLVAARLRPRA